MKRILISVLMALMLVTILALPAMAAEEETSTGASVTVGEFVNITLAGSIDFGATPPDTTEKGATGQITDSPAITITVESETNVNVDISIKGAIATGDLALSYWLYSKDFAKTGITGLTVGYVEVYDNVGEGVHDFYHWITVPPDTTPGSHTVTVGYKAATHS